MPLPKMVPQQMAVIHRRLESIGFRIVGDNPLKASKASTRILVDLRGLCSSNEDLVDAIAPSLPEVLALERKRVSFRVVRDSYFAAERRGNTSVVRFSPRLESESYWEELRRTGSCALTPDERKVYSAILSSRSSLGPLVTDFPSEGSKVRRIGHREYYDSKLEPEEAAVTLRGIGSSGGRNTYLPRNSLLSVSPALLPGTQLHYLLDGLGDWCFLSPR